MLPSEMFVSSSSSAWCSVTNQQTLRSEHWGPLVWFSGVEPFSDFSSQTTWMNASAGWLQTAVDGYRHRVISSQIFKTLVSLRHFCVFFPCVVVISLWSLWLLRLWIGLNVFYPWTPVRVKNVAAVRGVQDRFWANCQSDQKKRNRFELEWFLQDLSQHFFDRP